MDFEVAATHFCFALGLLAQGGTKKRAAKAATSRSSRRGCSAEVDF